MKHTNAPRSRSPAPSLAAAALIAVTLSAQQHEPSVVGDAARGKPLFSDTFNCYACHGFDAQSGERRLVPMNYTQEGFITFVQNSPLPNMPPFPDASRAAARRHLRLYPHDSRRRAGGRRRAAAARHTRAEDARRRRVAGSAPLRRADAAAAPARIRIGGAPPYRRLSSMIARMFAWPLRR